MTAYRRLVVTTVLSVGVLLVSLTGCGSSSMPTYPAGGKVIFPDGRPLEGGRVELRSVNAANNPVARGEVQPDGTFRLSTFQPNDGAVEGEHLALVVPPPPPPGSDTRGDKSSHQPVLDPRFMLYKTSGLKFTVTRDPAKNQITLQVDYLGHRQGGNRGH